MKVSSSKNSLSFAVPYVSFVVTTMSLSNEKPALELVASVPSSMISSFAFAPSTSVLSNTILNVSSDAVVPSSIMITSDVTSESSSVPVSNVIPPPITLTKPAAVFVSLSEVVKVRTSPTSYPEPASSTMTSLTEPLVIPLTTNVALSFPKFSISTGSWSVCKIPLLVSDAEDTIASTVNETSTSLTVEFAMITSPSKNITVISASSSSVTDCVPS